MRDLEERLVQYESQLEHAVADRIAEREDELRQTFEAERKRLRILDQTTKSRVAEAEEALLSAQQEVRFALAATVTLILFQANEAQTAALEARATYA